MRYSTDTAACIPAQHKVPESMASKYAANDQVRHQPSGHDYSNEARTLYNDDAVTHDGTVDHIRAPCFWACGRAGWVFVEGGASYGSYECRAEIKLI